MLEAILVIIFLMVLAVVAVYVTATTLTLIFKGTFELAPLWVKIAAWVMATIGAVASASFIYSIIILLPIV